MVEAQNFTYGVIWDVDGTLVDTAKLHFDAWRLLSARLGKEFTRDDFAETFGKRNFDIITSLYQSDLTPQQVDELGEQKEIFYRSEAQKGVDLLPGVDRLLKELNASGFKQAIGSSAPHENLRLITRITGSYKYFEAVVGAEDTSRGKPDPEVFLVAAKRIGIFPQNCVVIEDAVAGIEAARAGGMKCIGVTFVGHHSPEKLKEAGADLVVPSLDVLNVEDFLQLLRN